MVPGPTQLQTHHEPLTDTFPGPGHPPEWGLPEADRERFEREGHFAPLELLSMTQVDALRQRLSEAGRRRVEEKFSWESIAQETLQFYEEVVVRQKAAERTHA